MPTVGKKALNWFAFLSGVLFGIIALAFLGALEVYQFSRDDWYLIAAWMALGCVVAVGSWIAVWNRKLSAVILLTAAPVITVIALIGLIRYRPFDFAVGAAFVLVPLLPLGLFWHFTNRGDWPPLIVPGSAFPARRVIASMVAFSLLTCLTLIGSVVVTLLPRLEIGDCGRSRPFATRQYGGQIVFVAKLRDPGLAVVREHFWGLPSWNSRFVLIAHWGIGHNVLDGSTYFIDGHRSTGLLTRFLPIVEIQRCGRFRPIDQAALDIRMLRDGPSQKAVRVVGQVTGAHYKPRVGVRVAITGPAGTILTTTDREGIYDVADLPPGRYSVRAQPCDESKNPAYYRCGEDREVKLGDVWGSELRID
jgi:hypothetical protein